MQKGEPNSEIIIYEGDSGQPNIEVRIEGETVWLTQAKLAELFKTSRPNITMHIKNIFEEQELDNKAVCQNFLHTAKAEKEYRKYQVKTLLPVEEAYLSACDAQADLETIKTLSAVATAQVDLQKRVEKKTKGKQ